MDQFMEFLNYLDELCDGQIRPLVQQALKKKGMAMPQGEPQAEPQAMPKAGKNPTAEGMKQMLNPNAQTASVQPQTNSGTRMNNSKARNIMEMTR